MYEHVEDREKGKIVTKVIQILSLNIDKLK